MKKLFYACVALMLFTATSIQAEKSNKCTLSGLVKYYYNEYQGYKPDVGSKVILLPANEKSDSVVNLSQYNKYLSLAKKYMGVHIAISEYDAGSFESDFMEKSMRKSYDFSIQDEMNLKTMALYMVNIEVLISSMNTYETLVDGSGLYKIEIPYGEYYIIVISENRDRPFTPEILGNLYIEKINLAKSTYIYDTIKIEP